VTFRRDGQKSHDWHKWLLKNEATLKDCGLPEFILKDRLTWLNFIAKGRWWGDDGQYFHVDELSESRAQALFTLLETELTADEKVCTSVYRQLRSRPNRTP
jgi:hypothetical protein